MGIRSGIKKVFGRINESTMARKSRESEREANTRRRVNTLLNDKTDFTTIEAYKSIRTNIIFTLGADGERGKKVILTSAIPGEGKTTTCINLAIAFAMTGSRVIIIDGDLRKPRLYRHLSIKKENGLSDVLCGLIDVKQAIKHCPAHGLDVITSGPIPPNPAELISSERMLKMLDTLAESYDYIFVDTPPVTVVADATTVAKYVDGVVVIARQNYTIHESLQRAVTNLKFVDAKILGFILNDVPRDGNRYGSYKRYGRGYGYGYKYGYDYSYGEYADKAEKKAQAGSEPSEKSQ